MKRLICIFVLLSLALSACGKNIPLQTADEPLTWQEQYDLGLRYLSEGNYEEAILAFTAAIDIDPKRPEAYSGLADAYIGAGEIEKAIEILEQGCTDAGSTELYRKLLEQRLEQENSWKQAYLDFIEQDRAIYDGNIEMQEGTVYQLQYINDDNIPELTIRHPFHYAGGCVCTAYNGQIDVIHLDYGYFKYIKRGNLLAESAGSMDYYYDVVYHIEDGQFKENVRGTYQVLDWENYRANYVWAGQTVDENVYARELEKAFPAAEGISNTLEQEYSYWDILDLLELKNKDDLPAWEETDGPRYMIRRAMELDGEQTAQVLGDTVGWDGRELIRNAFVVERMDSGEQLHTFTVPAYMPMRDYYDMYIVSQTDISTVFKYYIEGGDPQGCGGRYNVETNRIEQIAGGYYERVGDYLIRIDETGAMPEALSLDICDLNGDRVERLVESGWGTIYYAEGNTVYYAYGTTATSGEIQIWRCNLENMEKEKIRSVMGTYPDKLGQDKLEYVVEYVTPDRIIESENRRVFF